MNAKVRAVRAENKLRLDLSSPLAGHLFSLVNNGSAVEYLAVRQKRHVKTRANAATLKDMIPVRINPKRLMNIYFGYPIEADNWSCHIKDGQVHHCDEKATKMKIVWDKPKKNQRLVRIEQPGVATLQISISDFSAKIDRDKNPFVLKVPKSFQKINR